MDGLCGLPLGGLLDVSPGGVVVDKIERSCTGPAQRNGCARMDERGTIAAGDDQGLVVVELAELNRLCVQCADRRARRAVGRRGEARRERLPRRHA